MQQQQQQLPQAGPRSAVLPANKLRRSGVGRGVKRRRGKALSRGANVVAVAG